MGSRLELHNILLTITPNVYYQPPETVKMVYPCIVYSLTSGNTEFADDRQYMFYKKYTISVIDKKPDGAIQDEVMKLQRCIFDRRYIAQNLYHDVLTIYY